MGTGETGIILGYDEMIMGHLEHSDDEEKKDDPPKSEDEKNGETVGDVLKTLTDKQYTAVCAVVGQIIEDAKMMARKPKKMNLKEEMTI